MSSNLPAWWSGKADKKKQNRRSARLERAHAERTGGRVQAGSGSSWRAPEDVVGPIDEESGEGFLDQHKYTDKLQFPIKRAEWDRLRRNALRAGRDPRLVIEFQDGERTVLKLLVTEDDAG